MSNELLNPNQVHSNKNHENHENHDERWDVTIQLPSGAPYQLIDNSFWPALVRQQAIPDTLRSGKATQTSKVGLGVVKAICRILSAPPHTGLTYDVAANH